jgi:hypothetical protein
MGMFDSLKKIASVSLAPVTGGLSLGAGGEDMVARIPLVGGFLGAETNSQKALVKKQEELAKEAELQRKRNAQARMQALGQSMLAFNPQNQMMAQMFGPQAAFSPQQMAQMAADPSIAGVPWGQGTDEQRQAQVKDKQRRQMIESQIQPLGPGPAPLKLPPPAAPRRY